MDLLTLIEVRRSHSDLEERVRLEGYISREQAVVEEVAAHAHRFSVHLHILDEPLCLPWSKCADEAEEDVHVVMVHSKVQVDSDAVDYPNVRLL